MYIIIIHVQQIKTFLQITNNGLFQKLEAPPKDKYILS